MRAATGLLVLVVGLLLLLRWNYNSTLEAETTLAHAKLREANLKLQAELATLKAQGEQCKLQATAQQTWRWASHGAEASAVVWSVWLRLAVTTPEATRSPRALLAVLRRAVDSLPTRSGMLQTLVAEWMATTLPASTVRELTPAIIALPATSVCSWVRRVLAS